MAEWSKTGRGKRLRGKRARKSLSWLLAIACGACWVDPAIAQRNGPAAASGPDKRALLVGINRYASPTVRPLRGAVNDVRNMKQLLVETFGFPDDSEHLMVLTDEEASREAILRAIGEHLIDKVGSRSIVVFYYSGHGSQRTDERGQGLVPHDSGREPDPNRDITDHEFNHLLAPLRARTRHVTFIFDTCYSGNAVRGAGRARTVEPDLRPAAAAPLAPGAAIRGDAALWRYVRPPYVLISAAAAHEEAREIVENGEHHGALTFYLAEQIRRAGPDATYRDVMDAVKGRVNARFRLQHPQLEGTGRDELVFGARSRAAAPYAVAFRAPAGKVRLTAGQVHGVTVGSEYDVYPPESKDFGPGVEPTARVEIESVEMTESKARVVSGNRRVADHSRAVERRHAFPRLRIGVHLMDAASSETLRKVAEELAAYEHLRLLPDPEGYHLLLREEEGFIYTEAGEPSEISPRVKTGETNAVDRVVDQVTQWAKWFAVLAIENPNVPIELGLEVRREGETTRGVPDREVDLTLADLETYRIAVTNRSDRPLYLSLLVLSGDGNVELVYPPAGALETVSPGHTVTVPSGEQPFEAFVPEGRQAVRDILKLFATTRPTDFSFLQQPAVRGASPPPPAAGSDTLEQLVAGAALGARRSATHGGGGEELWTSVDLVMEVRRTE